MIGHYRIIDLTSYTTYVVCVNYIHEWRDLQFKVDSERPIFWETFHGSFNYSQSVCQKFAEKKSPKKYFFLFSYSVLMSALRYEPGFYVYWTSTLLTRLQGLHIAYIFAEEIVLHFLFLMSDLGLEHYLLDHGDFNHHFYATTTDR